MEEEQKYKVITCIDPRKINVPIRDRFAKLTLSNKKQQPGQADAVEVDLGRNMEPVRRVSRNLMETLDTVIQNDSLKCASCNKNADTAVTLSNLDIPHYVNPLLLSESSGSIPIKQTCLDHERKNVQSEEMQPLKVSTLTAEDNLLDSEITNLTKEVSVMAASAKDLHVNRNDNMGHEITLLMSTESQRMSCEFLPNRLRTLTINPVDEEHVHKSESRQSVCISLSSTEDSYSAITITDSSVSDFMEFDCMTSEIPETGHTGDALIPNTFSNEKADRMEAFLRDVSQQRRELQENEAYDDNCTLRRDMGAHASKESVKAEEGNKQLGGLAYADTESMTTYSTDYRSEEYVDIISKKRVPDAEKETLSMSQIRSEKLSYDTTPYGRTQSIKNENEDARRLANDETQVNTSISQYIKDRWPVEIPNQDSNCSIVYSEQSSISDSLKRDVPEDSVVISETSTENISRSSVHESESSRSEEGNAENSSTTNSANPQKSAHAEISSINISAKINIKISISQLDSSGEIRENDKGESIKEYNSGSFVDNVQEDERNKTTTPRVNDELLETTCDRQRQERNKIEQAHVIEDEKNENINSEEEEEDANFLTHAEKLLNQIYGMSWKTPEIIRTLKRTSRTPKNTDCTPSPSTSKASTTLKEAKFDSNSKENIETAGYEKLMDKSVEQSTLDDFSIFRRDIARTNLDSTRFATPMQQKVQARTPAIYAKSNSEPRFITQRKEPQNFKVPKTEMKKKWKKNKVSADRWRQIVDEDSETSGDNASDDDTLDKTENPDSVSDNKRNEIDEDSEWSITSDDSEESDPEISIPKKGNKAQGRKQQQCNSSNKKEVSSTRTQLGKGKSKNALVYLDLSKDEVTIQESEPTSPPANNDANFNSHLDDILRTCKATDKAKLLGTPNTGGISKRKLFTANFGDEDVDLTVDDDGVHPRTPVRSAAKIDDDMILQDIQQLKLNDDSSSSFAIFNKHLEAIKRGDPIFKLTPPRAPATPKPKETPKVSRTLRDKIKLIDLIGPTPKYKYGFLKSLDVCVAKSLCHPDALCYRENYRAKKEELAKLLYELYNEKLFQNKLNVPIEWNKKLCNTAGRCLNKKKMGVRTSLIQLSEKVLTSADRLRCTLIHELCHAATWVFNGEGGHGSTWKQWALKANHIFPEIPKIGVCHQYDIEYKYTYKCTLCGAKSHAHSKSKKVENIRCSFCHGAIEIFLNKKDKDGNILPTPVREPTGFAKFVKDNYKQYKRPDLKHTEVMKILSTEFAALKVPSSR